MPLVRELPRFSNPGHCIMFPGRRRDERGFYLFETVIDGPHGDIQVGISGEALRTIAERHGTRFGIVKREKYDKVVQRSLELKNRVLELEQENEALKEQQDRIAGLVADGFKVQRKMGRPAKKEDE